MYDFKYFLKNVYLSFLVFSGLLFLLMPALIKDTETVLKQVLVVEEHTLK